MDTTRARGQFEVKIEPAPGGPEASAVEEGAAQLGRMLLHKRFSGDLEGTGVRATIVRPGATRSEFGFGWEADILGRVIDSWKAWGFMRHLDMMDGEQVALAVVAAVTAPPGLHVDVIQVNPERAPTPKD